MDKSIDKKEEKMSNAENDDIKKMKAAVERKKYRLRNPDFFWIFFPILAGWLAAIYFHNEWIMWAVTLLYLIKIHDHLTERINLEQDNFDAICNQIRELREYLEKKELDKFIHG